MRGCSGGHHMNCGWQSQALLDTSHNVELAVILITTAGAAACDEDGGCLPKRLTSKKCSACSATPTQY